MTINPIRMRVNADGTVRGNGLSGPMTFALDGAPAGWYLKSFFIDGIDATRVPFDFGSTGRPYRDVEAVISNATGTVTGRAVDRNGIGVNDYAAIVFSVDSADWFSASNRLALARADGDGGFQVDGLPPGDYWIAAIAQPDVTVTNGEWRRSDALARLMPSAQRVTVTSHQTVSTTLRLVR